MRQNDAGVCRKDAGNGLAPGVCLARRYYDRVMRVSRRSARPRVRVVACLRSRYVSADPDGVGTGSRDHRGGDDGRLSPCRDYVGPFRPSDPGYPRTRSVGTEGYLALANALRPDQPFPELILVAISPEAPLVVLEGHVRLTAAMLRPDLAPAELSVIVGYSDAITQWSCY